MLKKISYIMAQNPNIHPSWDLILKEAFEQMEPAYLNSLIKDPDWLPGLSCLLNAFSVPFDQVNYVLLGESPYPRSASANGYAFWDARVKEIWSDQGLSKTVNRATSLRNIIKMLLAAEGLLTPEQTSPEFIQQLNKAPLVQTLSQLFQNFLNHGFLLLNAALVLSKQKPQKEFLYWQPFTNFILMRLIKTPHDNNLTLILLGKIAYQFYTFKDLYPHTLIAEHPYNLSFIKNEQVLSFFKFFHLLKYK